MIDRLDEIRKQSKNTEAVAVGEKELDGNGGKERGERDRLNLQKRTRDVSWGSNNVLGLWRSELFVLHP